MRAWGVFSVLLLLLSQPAFAATLCTYAGPDTSSDYIRLTDLTVSNSGSSTPQVGDTITAAFTLQAYGQTAISLGAKGFFAAALLSQNDKSFGYSYANAILKAGESRTISVSRILDEAGTWRIWPSYNLISGNQQNIYGPVGWHECSFTVVEKTQTPPLPSDADKDGIPDSQDNCPAAYNPQQEDVDSDGIGDKCDQCDDRDSDKDGIKNCIDKCPYDAETFNKLKDEDGCPDSAVASPDFKITITKKLGSSDNTNSNASDKSKKNNSVSVQAYSSGGISSIEVFVDGMLRIKCFKTETCEGTIPDLNEESGVGARAFGSDGSFGVGGSLPAGSESFDPGWVEDSDSDGIINIDDNCVLVPNEDQADSDHDGVGDACDQCDAVVRCRESGFGRLSDLSYAECFGSEHMRFRTAPPYYFDAFYDFISTNGCGCTDPDGFDYFLASGSITEQISTSPDMSFEGGRERTCRAISACVIGAEDRCLSSTTLSETYCSSEGIQNRTITCPAGCRDGACLCPDTDGGFNIYQKGGLLGQAEYCTPHGFLKEADCILNRNGSLAISWSNITCRFGCYDGACVCDDSDHGRNYSMRGTVGGTIGAAEGYTDYCIDSRTLVEYSAFFARDGVCYLDNHTYRCEGLCSEGRCLPPTCNDRIRNQNETDVDCGGPCTECGYVKFNGTLYYEEAHAGTNRTYVSNGTKPIRYIGVMLIPTDSSGHADMSFSTLMDIRFTATDSRGYFEFIFPREENRTYMIRIKPTNYAARVEKDYDGCNEYVWFDSYYDWAIPETGDVNLGNMEILREWPRDFNGFWSENHEWFCGDEGGRIDGGSAYFNIAESILVARMFTDANRAEDDSIGQVDVAYPDPTSNGNAFENPFWDEIYLPPPNSYTDYLDYGFVDQVIVHEYAHHLEEEISENDMEFGQDHNFCTNIDEEFAWTEGFADFFSIFIGNKYRDDPAHYMSLVRQKFVKTETPDCYVNYAVEGGIEAVLWDLTDAVNASFPDSVNESFDTISGQEHLIMVIFDTEMDNYVDAPDICEFIWNGNGWMGRTRGSRLEYAINPMLDMYNITNDC